ncbi:hypothetical protein ACRALDRAFT_1077372 [Sodiomyces alcalophilus JCM 7366]|uniref:uncharacterized protein n=1 Tax=Sodiomyces alcalophilus JCM 7366 TaxID=591952 RepID=UPI0039B379B9
MAQDSEPLLLAFINNARTYAEQASALRSLKNDIVGHAQKKKSWVGLGVLRSIVGILQASKLPSKANGKLRQASANAMSLSEEESVRLHALQVLSSFANGGRAFVQPIIASGAIAAILPNISPATNSPLLVVAALKALLNIADAALLTTAFPPPEIQQLADSLFSAEYIHELGEILLQSDDWNLPSWQYPVPLVTALISRLCRDEKSSLALADSEVLDLLARELARFVVARDLVSGSLLSTIRMASRCAGLADFIPPPACPGSDLASLLEALTAIVSDSRYRVSRLESSPAILAVFPHFDYTSPPEAEEYGKNSDMVQPPGVPRHRSHDASRTQKQSPLGATGAAKSGENTLPFARSSPGRFGHGLPVQDASRHDSPTRNEDTADDMIENPIIPWLVTLCREGPKAERLMAAGLLASLFKYGRGSRRIRTPKLDSLVIPVLVDMARDGGATAQATQSSVVGPSTSLTWTVSQRLPVVLHILSRLITDMERLQDNAFQSGAVEVLSKLLKDSYEPVPSSASARPWSPQADSGMVVESSSPDCQLGPEPENPLLAYRVRLREASLKAIAALASGKQDYRQKFADQDILPYVVQSLSTTPGKPSGPKDRSKKDEADGPLPDPATSGYGSNPLSVVIAACHTVLVLSRSVMVLRTALVDHGVEQPILQLMKHPDVDVQVAATAVVCNLVIGVSPMKTTLISKGVMKVLCEHAHSATAALRLNAMWALKLLVHDVGTDVRKQCLQELDPDWLVRLICDDTEDDALHSDKSNDERQFSGGKGSDVDGDVEMERGDGPIHFWYGSTGIPRDCEDQPVPWALDAEARTLALRAAEMNPQRKARNDDLAIQEQALDFIRNLIGHMERSTEKSGGAEKSSSSPGQGSSSETGTSQSTEMIDHLFQALGQARFFGMLTKKLQAKVLRPGTRRTGGETRVLYPQSKVIEAVIYVLVHIAASVPRHRQVIIAQTDLLKLLGNHFSSKDKDVRLALCALMTNLTWPDDDSDARACGQRAQEVKKLGILGKLEALEEDPGLDVRERAKIAVWQTKQALF